MLNAEPPMNIIAEALATCMKEKRLSARALALEIGLSHPTVVALTRGTSDVQLTTLKTLARYFEWGPAETGQAAWAPPTPITKKQKASRPSGSIRRRR